MIKIIPSTLLVMLCLCCCGCPRPGGDGEVSLNATRYGTGEILTVTEDANGEKVVSLNWTYRNGDVLQDPIENVKLSTVKDLPADLESNVGTKLPLAVDIEWIGKASVGPPAAWDKVDNRVIRFLPDGLPK